MKIALCTTTIHIPHALKLLRKCSPDVRFFVTGDMKTPTPETYQFLIDVDNCRAFVPEEQMEWKCSELIGWNTLARRNIAFLEALKWGAEVIVAWDDDNIPVHASYFSWFEMAVDGPFYGLKVSSSKNWFDPGHLLLPQTPHRGYPAHIKRNMEVGHIENAKVGVAAGLVLGDPDIDAVTRIATSPDIQSVSEIGRAGVVVDLNNWTVFNSQNTAVIRELIPAWFMMPNVGRHDDIYASLIVQCVARERNLHVHFGQPFTYQQRNEHDLLVDLKTEISGMENTIKLADLLDSIILKGRSVIEDTRTIYQTLLHCSFIPEASARAGLAWLEDCESVL